MLTNSFHNYFLFSSNHLETCAALAATCKLATEDMIPAIIGDVSLLTISDIIFQSSLHVIIIIICRIYIRLSNS